MENDQRTVDTFDLNAYFNKGRTIATIPLPKSILEGLRKENWEALPNGFLAPVWSNKSHTDEVPEYLKDLAGELAQSGYYEWFTKIYGDFTQRSVAVYKLTEGAQLNWRSDAYMGTFLATFLFLGDETVESDGGQFHVGICDSDEDGVPNLETVVEQGFGQPNPGLAVTLYNMNPTVVHRIAPLVRDKEVYVIAIYLGYIENTIMRTT